MRVLWVCNIMLPVIAEALHREASNKEGWLSGLLSQIVDREDTFHSPSWSTERMEMST